MRYYFFLGRTTALCHAELEVVVARFGGIEFSEVRQGLWTAEFGQEVQAKELQLVLGGTVKIAVHQQTVTSQDQIFGALLSLLQERAQDKKIYFACQILSPGIEITPIELKKALTNAGVSSRFAESDRWWGVEAAVLTHRSLTELFVLAVEDSWVIAETVAVQNIDDWSIRDYEKPYRDAKKGMLPPKVARMMVNLGLGSTKKQQTLLDPFCGTGTVLLEALLLNQNVVGVDQDKDSIHGTSANIHWLQAKHTVAGSVRLSIQDAVQVSTKETGGLVDVLVTEPFLGKPSPTLSDIKNIAVGLEKLYLGCFKKWRHVLKPGARVVVVMPRWVDTEANDTLVKNMSVLVDRLGSLGYTREKNPFLYSRPQSQVQREIYVFSFNENKE